MMVDPVPPNVRDWVVRLYNVFGLAKEAKEVKGAWESSVN